MITAILETREHKVVGTTAKAGNEQFLIGNGPQFPKLSLLNEIDYDVFSAADMPELIGELSALKESLSEQNQAHVIEIIELAVLCRDGKGTTLTFTPFE